MRLTIERQAEIKKDWIDAKYEVMYQLYIQTIQELLLGIDDLRYRNDKLSEALESYNSSDNNLLVPYDQNNIAQEALLLYGSKAPLK